MWLSSINLAGTSEENYCFFLDLRLSSTSSAVFSEDKYLSFLAVRLSSNTSATVSEHSYCPMIDGALNLLSFARPNPPQLAYKFPITENAFRAAVISVDAGES